MSEQQYLWAPTPDKPKRGRVWLIVLLAVVALLIVGGVLWAFLRPGAPVADPTSSTSASPSASASPTPSTSPTSEPTPTDPPVTSPPPPPAPDLGAFRDSVSPVLADAQRGLQIVRESDPQEAVQNVGLLQEDAGRLAEVISPSSIASRWSSALDTYAKSLQSLRSAYEGGTSAEGPLSDATNALKSLNDIVAGR
ncbi:hypothetical protein ACTJJ4_05030 [Microbacterium sp. 22195]|uniref:hypothetical protein n=1 Tax=Microbacterium sp. 22195 TaxID=3453891 RepID=UPI003F827779